jgi:hypothetical protein
MTSYADVLEKIEHRRSKTYVDPHKKNLKEILIPYYKEKKFIDLKENDQIDKIPDMLWANFNPLPSPEIQEKINIFYLPINYSQNFSKYMKFETDEKLDILNKLKTQYQVANSIDKKTILKAIAIIEGEVGQECSW